MLFVTFQNDLVSVIEFQKLKTMTLASTSKACVVKLLVCTSTV